jgi:hypothetical protein
MAKTADQVVVEIQAVTDQYTKAIKKVADDTKRSMAAVEGAVTKAEAKITKASSNAAAATEKSSRRRMKAAADAATSEQAAAERSAKALKKAATDAERSTAKIEAAAGRRANAAPDADGGATAQASAAQRTAAQGREMAGGDDKKGGDEKKGGRGVEFAAELAKQLPDLTKNLIAGQGALQLFVQAGTALLPVFGPWGTVLAGLIGTVYELSDGFTDFGGILDRLTGHAQAVAEAEQRHFEVLQKLRDIYDQLKTASGDRATALKAEADALIAKGGAEELAAAKSKLAEAERARDALTVAQKTGMGNVDPEGYGFMAQQGEVEAAQNQVDALKQKVQELKDAAAGTEHVFDPINASLDELSQHLGKIAPGRILQSEVDLAGPNKAVQALVSQVTDAEAQTASFEQQYAKLLHQLSDATGWDEGSVKMAQFIQDTLGIAEDLRKVKINADEAAASYKVLLAQFGVSVSALPIVTEIGRIKDALDQMAGKAESAFAGLASKIGTGLATFLTGRGGTVIPSSHHKQPPINPDLFPVSDRGNGGTKTTPSAAGAVKKEKEPTLGKYLDELKASTAQLALNGVALKENELWTQALEKAKQDLANGLRKQEGLYTGESQQIHDAAVQLAGVPGILQIAADKLPEFSLKRQLATLDELKGLLTDPAIIAALQAQGLSAVDAVKLIDAQIAAAKDTASGTTEAIKGIGDALNTGIQGAQNLEDALLKVGVALGQMLLQAAAFGGTASGGPLGKAFDSIFGLVGGLAGLLGGGGSQGITNLPAGMSANEFYTDPAGLAGGGQALPGQIYQVGETGREWFAPSVPGQVIPNSVIKNAAGGGGGSGQPIQFNISLAGANGDRAIAEIAAAAVKKGLQSVPEINRQHAIRFA